MSQYRLTRSFHFSAGHRLASAALSDEENARLYGQCFRPHGHNYTVEVTLTGTLDPVTGMAGDLGELDATVAGVLLDRVDHYDLSSAVPALDGVITTGENLARTFWAWLAAALPPGRLVRVAVVETANNTFEYCG
ncbi:MAG TPA: 6-carboxytetrahydropterin synthase [Verrucomicrobiae bacterium]|nr:6-carboxytetrahydropterin synthase [Verrucomicrobiae bacterium]